jgi:hypothetical protein
MARLTADSRTPPVSRMTQTLVIAPRYMVYAKHKIKKR